MEPHTQSVFGGIDPQANDPTVPGWYRDHYDERRGSSVEFDSFHSTVGDLRDRFGAETTEAYYKNDEGEFVEVPHRRVVVNPDGDGMGGSGAWTTASDSYEPVDHMDAYGPLVAVAREAGYEDVFGAATTYRNGGETVIEVLFNDLRVTDPEDETEFVIGFETGFDHFKRSSVWASLMAYDAETGAALRGLSEKYSSPHRGDITERLADWFRTMLDRAENLGDAIYEQVAEAREYEVPLYELPVSVAEFYEALGFPASWGREAASSIRDTRTPTAFTLYLAMAEVITTEFDGKRNGDALRRHATRVNELLYAPDAAERRALVEARDSITEDGQTTLDPEFETAADAARAQLDDRIGTLGEGVEAFETMRDRIKTMIETMDEADEATDEDEPSDEQGDENEQELVTDGGVDVPEDEDADGEFCEACGEVHEDPSSEDIRTEVVEELAGAHAAAVAYVRFPREDNGLDEVDATTAMFLLDDDLSRTEEIAARSIIEDGTGEMADRAEGGGGQAVAMPAPPGLAEALGGMVGGGSDEDGEATEAERRGFQ